MIEASFLVCRGSYACEILGCSSSTQLTAYLSLYHALQVRDPKDADWAGAVQGACSCMISAEEVLYQQSSSNVHACLPG